MNIAQIELNLKNLIASFDKETFIYELLLAYGLPKASVTRLKKGNLNLSTTEGEITWKKKLFFKEEYNKDLHLTISEISKNIKHNERFIIVTDYRTLLAIDTKTEDKLDCLIMDLPKHYDFFLPWAGMEKAQHANENPADVKAAEKMAKLFDEIKKDNPDDSPEFIHGLNAFLSHLLFCFFAEDTTIFEDNQFTSDIDSHTQQDGSDLDTYLDRLFTVLNTPENKRENLPDYLNAYPFVNGGLFKNAYKTPKFSRQSRAAILNSGDQDWSTINPDIFGSMFQAVIGAEQRSNLGQHYTSVPNIMKVIKPLFLNELYEEFEKAVQIQNPSAQQKAFAQLLNRLYNIKIFDPACGSGNFLIIAYKELRILEMKIFKAGELMALSGIQLSQFYGIEIDDFAGEIAKLALWLAEHQMNVEFFQTFGRTNPTLPLKEAGKIVQGNACRLNWEEVCQKNDGNEIYILGNPPYLGSSMQDSKQKSDLSYIFNGFKNYKNLDYIACWFKKGADYIKGIHSSCSFVSTNSIVQGEQVGLLWPYIFQQKTEIGFAYNSFYWSNSAKAKAAVSVVIIGLRNISKKPKCIITDGLSKNVDNINPYLSEGENIAMPRRSHPISNIPKMVYGNKSTDDGQFFLTCEERISLLYEYPTSKKFIKKLVGSLELIKGIEKYCLWIEDDDLDEAKNIPFIEQRLENVKVFRKASKAQSTVEYSLYPNRFKQRTYNGSSAIVIPRVSSERRKYVPFGFVDSDTVVLDSAQAIYNAEPWILGVVLSNFHNIWVRATSGRLESRIRYSSALSYNNFPFPPISNQRKNEITQATLRILEEREKHSDKTLAHLYDPDKMPDGLREAHHQNDLIIEKCYRSTPFTSDEERLEYLFKLYEKMIAEEEEQETLFAKEKGNRKKKK